MGQEIDATRFSNRDFQRFQTQINQETDELAVWFQQHRFDSDNTIGGFELEAWLIDNQCRPAPANEHYLKTLQSDQVVPELARFNVELNSPPQPLQKAALSQFHHDLQTNWDRCCLVAEQLGLQMVMIGILPTLQEAQLNLDNMSDLQRYRALNEQVLLQRKGRPIHLDILGHQHLKSDSDCVMLEAAATSFQIHLQPPSTEVVRSYNASLIASAPMVAIAANAPYLFTKQLWEDTRIPLFEQSVESGGIADAAHGPLHRVTFGSDYLRHSLLEAFIENKVHYPPLLPSCFHEDLQTLPHLRLHNGTIWRWNRPILGFDEHGNPRLRIEHRSVSAGPTVIDAVANAAFYFGLVQTLAGLPLPPESALSFSQAKDNFYQAARFGLKSHVVWLDGRRFRMDRLILDQLLPEAALGLDMLGIDRNDSDRYLTIIERRVASGQNGATWQRRFVQHNGADMQQLTAAYLERQQSGTAVHEWD